MSNAILAEPLSVTATRNANSSHTGRWTKEVGPVASVEDLIAAVKTQITALEEAKALVSRGQAALSGSHQAMTGISRGSTNYKLTVTLEALSAAIGAAQQAEAAGTSAVEQFTTYLTAIGAPVAWTANSIVHPAVRKVPEADPTVRSAPAVMS